MPDHTELYPGRRVSYDGALCTIRCRLEAIPGTKGQWLGVEWDDVSRGKHNGTHNNVKYFECRSSQSTAASFVRPTRKADPEQTVLEAIQSKYVADDSQQQTQDAVTISGKVVEEVGFEKIIKQQSVLANLKVAVLDHMTINGVAPRSSSSELIKKAKEELGSICPNIIELDLSHNPIETWAIVEDICSALPKLRTLKLSSIRLRDLLADPDCTKGYFRNVQELHLNECLLRPSEVVSILQGINETSRFPSLRSLWLSQNELSAFDLQNSATAVSLQSVRTLMLENNFFTSLDPLAQVLSLFPALSHISVQANRVSAFGSVLLSSRRSYITLQNLDLSQNHIASFSFVDSIPETFPSLSALRLSRNSVYDDSQSNKTSVNSTEKSYYLTLARIPKLKTLNYTDITPREREEGEIYYLSVAEKDIRAWLADTSKVNEAVKDLKKHYPRYDTLCKKHDRENLIKQLTSPSTSTDPSSNPIFNHAEPTYPPGSIASRLVDATFYTSKPTPTSSTPTKTSFSRPLPKTIPTSSVFALVSRELHLPALSFKLVYESEELDPVRDDLTTRSQIYADPSRGANRWDDWGDWDADALVERSSKVEDGQEKARMNINVDEGKWTDDGVLVRNGRKWKRREVDVLFGMRGWGDWLESGVKRCVIRVEPVERKKMW